MKWIRVLYSDFTAFTRDQEQLISAENTFGYIEGFVIINRTGLLNNWRSSFNPQDPIQASQFKSDGRTLFCLELAKYFNPEDIDVVNQVRPVTAQPKDLFYENEYVIKSLIHVVTTSKKFLNKLSLTVFLSSSFFLYAGS